MQQTSFSNTLFSHRPEYYFPGMGQPISHWNFRVFSKLGPLGESISPANTWSRRFIGPGFGCNRFGTLFLGGGSLRVPLGNPKIFGGKFFSGGKRGSPTPWGFIGTNNTCWRLTPTVGEKPPSGTEQILCAPGAPLLQVKPVEKDHLTRGGTQQG